MPEFTLGESNAEVIDLDDLIPEGHIVQVEVLDVKQVEKKYEDDFGNKVQKVAFKTRVNAPGEVWDGRTIWGETSTNFVEHPDCKLRNWSQAIMGGQEFPLGYKLDTDILLGRQVRAYVERNEWTDKTTSEPRANNRISDLLPTKGTQNAAAAAAPDADGDPF